MEFRKFHEMPVFYLLVLMFTAFNLWLFFDSKAHSIESIQKDSKLMAENPDDFAKIYTYDYYADVDMGQIKEMAQLDEEYEKTAESFAAANYNRLQQRADAMMHKEKESLTFTGLYRLHEFLFSYYLKYMMIEGIIIIILAVIYAMHFEVIHGTEDIVLTSKAGMNIYRIKLWAAFLFALMWIAVIMTISLGVYFGLIHYSEIWNSYVSSSFNTGRRTINGVYMAVYPYVTWVPMTIGQYFYASLAVVFGIYVCCTMIVGKLSKRLKNSITVLAVIGTSVAGFYFIGEVLHFTGWTEYIVKLNPVHLVLKCGYWFMDYAPGDTYPFYEILVVGIGLIPLLKLLCYIRK